MAEHPFHGRWSSYVVRDTDHAVLSSFFELEITPQGQFVKGWRKKRTGYEAELDGSISNDVITLKERSGDGGTFRGKIEVDLSGERVKVLAGRAAYPERIQIIDLLLGQNDGTWIGTQP